MKSFLSNLNTRLIVIHFIAFWFFAYAFFTLAFLYDYDFMHSASEHMLYINDKGRQVGDKELYFQAGNFGLLAAYIISWWFSSKRNWHWINAVIIFMVSFALYNFGYWGWNVLHSIFQIPGSVFPKNSKGSYLTNGMVMLGIGLAIFFINGIKRYIDNGNASSAVKGNKADRKAAKAKFKV